MNFRFSFNNLNAQAKFAWAIWIMLLALLVTACPTKTPDDPPKPPITPAKLAVEAQLNFGKTDTEKRFTIQNTGGETLTWTSSSDQDWLTLTPANGTVEAAKTVTITVTVDRSKLTAGTNTADLKLAAQKDGTDIDGSPVNLAVQAFRVALPTVRFERKDLTAIRTDGATAAGELVAIGSSPVTQRGHVWSLAKEVVVGKPNTFKTEQDGQAGAGRFSSMLTNLQAGKTYYVRAYATNSEGTGYSDELDFATLHSPPVVTFTAANLGSITAISAIAAANLTVLGSAPIIQRGHVWSSTANPMLSTADVGKTERGAATTTGQFSSSLTGLTAGQTYYIRAYVRTATDTVYSAELNFNTSRILPVLTFTQANLTNIGRTSATAGATLTVLGSAPIIQRGHVWSLTANPTLASAGSAKTELGIMTTTGGFSSSLTGLTAQQTYFVRAYVRTGSDTVYTAALTLATLGDLNLTPTSIAENQASGATVGTLSTAGGSGFTYTLVSGEGSDNNAAFTIDGTTLKTARVFNFETKASYKIRVRSVKGGQQFERAFVISVTNVNEIPTALALNDSTVSENVVSGTPIGTFRTTDPDAGDRHGYSFAAGGADNASFTIDDAVLKTRAALDYESDSVYEIRVTSTDAGNLSVSQAFRIRVRNVNEAPTAVALSRLTIAENSAIGTTIGVFSTTDPDISDRHTYSFAAGGADNSSFEIDGNILKTRTTLDYETDSTYAIRVKSRDAGGLEKTQNFNLKVTDVMVAATNILLSYDSIREGNAVGDTIGSLSSAPAESQGQFSLVAGVADNGSFRLSGDTLKAAAVFNFTTKSTYTIRLRTTNAAGSFDKTLTIKVKANQPPSVPVLTSPANSATGIALNTKLLWQASRDPEDDAFTYTVLLSTNNPPTDMVAKNQTAVEYTPTGQSLNTVYYWRIVAQDNRGKVATSPIRSYTTNRAPTAPTLISPANNAIVDTTRTPTLKWTSSTDPDGDALTYDVYLGTNNPPTTKVASGQADTTFTTARLKFKTDYYWKVIAKDGKGGEVSSTVPKFTSADIGAVWVDAGATGHWSARISLTAVAYKDTMYVMGGYDGTTAFNEVWSSTNGKDWTKETNAPWKCRYVHASVVFNGKIYVMGGFAQGSCVGGSSGRLNDVWAYDGTKWDSVKTTAHWSKRFAMAAAVYDNKIWVMGGNDEADDVNDVWYSSDGKNWTNANASSHWDARRYPATAVLNSKLWLYGGETNNDEVWSTINGSSWTNANANSHWDGRSNFQGLTAANKLWVIGGFNTDPGINPEDVWYSSDGNSWTRATAKAPFGSEYNRYAAVVFDNKIWLFGGRLGRSSGPRQNKVWYTDLAE